MQVLLCLHREGGVPLEIRSLAELTGLNLDQTRTAVDRHAARGNVCVRHGVVEITRRGAQAATAEQQEAAR